MSCARLTDVAGAVVSSVKARDAEPVLPAASVSLTVTACGPSPNALGASVQVPNGSATVVAAHTVDSELHHGIGIAAAAQTGRPR